MSDVIFPAKVTITREVDVYGLPVTRAYVEVDDETKTIPLPAGKPGEPGPRGRPRAPWVKAGEVATEAGLPTGLGADDRGKWWHVLATNDMWTWTGAQWRQSVDAVGPQGPVAPSAIVNVIETISNPKLRIAGADLKGVGAERDLRITVPAGPRGDTGPVGPSGSVRTSDDYDNTVGLVNGSLFAWNRITRKLRAMPPPGPIGLWAKGPADFPATTSLGNFDTIDLVTIDIPALPFAWRPRVNGLIATYADDANRTGYPHVWARLNDPSGQPVAMGLNPFRTLRHEVTLCPYYSEQGGTATANNYGEAARLSASSTVGVVKPYEPAKIYIRIERDKGDATAGSNIQFVKTMPYVQVQALPLRL
ncbi:hypothetical protein [Rhodococcus sp. YH1]|uniref:hypothetical protein n=1 Tax=Rhodococcus sp. YH1 TaxID=89066 RepID=UPI0013871ACE|nr:hypothetical protein [Rhodococcus sp. YH1]